MSNPYVHFLKLIPKMSVSIAKVVTPDDGSGDVEVELPGSSDVIKVRGDGSSTYAVGDHVYIVDKVIQAKTPTVQQIIDVEVY